MPSRNAPPAAEAAPPSKGEATRARLIAAAYTLFLKQGFHGTSMREIADEAGLAVGGIYNHFANKEEIFAAVLDANHPYHTVFPALEQTEGATVEAFVRNAAQHFKAGAETAGPRLLPLAFVEAVEFQGRHLRALTKQLLPVLAGFMRRLQTRRGRLRALPAPVLLRVFFGLLLGYLATEWVMRGMKPVPELKGLDDYPWFDAFIDVYLHGILAEPEEAAA